MAPSKKTKRKHAELEAELEANPSMRCAPPPIRTARIGPQTHSLLYAPAAPRNADASVWGARASGCHV